MSGGAVWTCDRWSVHLALLGPPALAGGWRRAGPTVAIGNSHTVRHISYSGNLEVDGRSLSSSGLLASVGATTLAEKSTRTTDSLSHLELLAHSIFCTWEGLYLLKRGCDDSTIIQSTSTAGLFSLTPVSIWSHRMDRYNMLQTVTLLMALISLTQHLSNGGAGPPGGAW